MVNGELWALRDKAHRQFDKFYAKVPITKEKASRLLAGILHAYQSEAHIGFLHDYYREMVIEESKNVLDRYQSRGISG